MSWSIVCGGVVKDAPAMAEGFLAACISFFRVCFVCAFSFLVNSKKVALWTFFHCRLERGTRRVSTVEGVDVDVDGKEAGASVTYKIL